MVACLGSHRHKRELSLLACDGKDRTTSDWVFPVLSTDSCLQHVLSDCRCTVRRSPDLQVTKSLLCMQPGVVGEEVPYPRCSNLRAMGMKDLDYIPTPNAIGHSWAYQ